MTIRQALSHVGPWQAALAIGGSDPWGRTCRTQAAKTNGARRAAWTALGRCKPQDVRDALAAQRITHI